MCQQITFLSLAEYNIDKSVLNTLNTSDFILNIIFTSFNKNGTINNTVGSRHVNLFSALLNDLKKPLINALNKGIIKITFANDIINFDLSLIGLIAIFKNQYNFIDFEIIIPSNSDIEVFTRFRDILISVRNWYLSFTNISLFRIHNEKKFRADLINEPLGVLPIFLINNDSFNKYFISTESTQDNQPGQNRQPQRGKKTCTKYTRRHAQDNH